MNLQNIVVIVGRPNVGKSTLFNRLAGYRVSIVHEEPGVTRDRVEVNLDWNRVGLRLVDTGGIDPNSSERIPRQIREQVQEALKEGTLLLFVVDARDGLTSLDEEVAAALRRSGKRTILIVNKVDHLKAELEAQEFYKLGFDTVIPVSSVHGTGFLELVEEIEKNLANVVLEEKKSIRVAVLGKPNVGKSTLINHLLGQNRLIVDAEPGTTRDAVDVEIRINERSFTFVDTAGMRKRNQVRTGVETFSVLRALRSLERADLAILVLDVSRGVMAQDVRILNEIRKAGKGCVLALNKWDLVAKITEEDFSDFLEKRWKFLEIYPKVYCSALKDLRLKELMDQVIEVYENSHQQISEEDLSNFLEKVLTLKQPPSDEGKIPKFYSMFQVGVSPPQFKIQVNQPKIVKESYKLFIDREFRKSFGFRGVPVQFQYKPKNSRRFK
jgi:GTP-binding protein